MLVGLLAPSALGNQRHPFTDVSVQHDAAVQFLWERGIMVGTSSTQFSPNANLTRAMVATILYRVAGEPQQSFNNVFTDVPSGRWYSVPISWAHANNVVQGVTSTRFAPNDNLTREQLAAMTFRYAQSNGWDVSFDSRWQAPPNTSTWAISYVQWAVERGFMPVNNGNVLAPNATATRGETANFIHLFMVRYNVDRPVNPPQGGNQQPPTGNIDTLTQNGATLGQLLDAGVSRSEIQGAFNREMIRLVNNIRREHGLWEFTVNPTLGNVAQLRAEESMRHNSGTHTSETTGLDFTNHFTAMTGLPTELAAENLSAGHMTPQGAFNGWLASPGHRNFIFSGHHSAGAWAPMVSINQIGVGFDFDQNVTSPWGGTRFTLWLSTPF